MSSYSPDPFDHYNTLSTSEVSGAFGAPEVRSFGSTGLSDRPMTSTGFGLGMAKPMECVPRPSKLNRRRSRAILICLDRVTHRDSRYQYLVDLCVTVQLNQPQ